jgi:hypothetical protein
MNGTQIFDLLLQQRQVTLAVSESAGYSIHALRVSLIRKFKDYKQQMTALGFLDADLENAVVSMELDEDKGTATFRLRPRNRKQVSYMIIAPATGTDSNLPESDAAV